MILGMQDIDFPQIYPLLSKFRLNFPPNLINFNNKIIDGDTAASPAPTDLYQK